MDNKNKTLIILLSIFLVSLISCKDEPQEPTLRTIVMYLVATNTLQGSIESDIEEVEDALLRTNMNNCRLLVYHTTYSKTPILFEFVKDKKGIKRNTIKTYTDGLKSTSADRMSQVLSDAITYAPAKEYGLILGSHASGWASSLTGRSNISTLDFGDDNGHTMPIHELAKAIPSNTFKFIYNDACYMAGIEVAYELRNKTDFFIASVTELPVDGMDYMNNIPCFFANVLDLKKICNNTFEKYNTKSGSSRTCTISLVDCAELDKLASICYQIHHNGIGTKDYFSIQRYKRDYPYLFFDLKQYTNTFTSVDNQEYMNSLQNSFNNQMEKVVLYKANTPFIFNTLSISDINYSGLSTYILGTTLSEGVNENYYRTLSWFNDVIK